MIYTVLAVIFLHICVLPITVRTSVSVDTDKGRIAVAFKLLFIPVFVKNVQIKSDGTDSNEKIEDDRKSESEKSEHDEKQKSAVKRAFAAYLKNFALSVAGRIRVRQMDLTAAIGTGDAAVTATAVGMIKIAYSQACAFLGYAGNSDGIRPDYQSEYIFMDFYGIFSLCLADIIYAANAAIEKTVRRGKRKNRRKAYATNLVAERTAGSSD